MSRGCEVFQEHAMELQAKIGTEKNDGVRIGVVSRSLGELDDHAKPVIRHTILVRSIFDLHQITELKLLHHASIAMMRSLVEKYGRAA